MIYTIDDIKSKITPVAIKYSLPVVYIFGSYARNEATEESDVDVLIDCDGSKVISLFDMGNLYNDLCESLNKGIDLVTIDALEQEDTKEETPEFVETLNKERIAIYERK